MAVVWWCALLSLWLLLLGARGLAEVAAGAIVAALAALAVLAARRHGLLPEPAVSSHAVRKALTIPAKLVVESWLVAAASLEAVTGDAATGSFTESALTDGPPPPGRAGTAAIVLVDSFTPNEYVVAVDDTRQVKLAHQLVPG